MVSPKERGRRLCVGSETRIVIPGYWCVSVRENYSGKGCLVQQGSAYPNEATKLAVDLEADLAGKTI